MARMLVTWPKKRYCIYFMYLPSFNSPGWSLFKATWMNRKYYFSVELNCVSLTTQSLFYIPFYAIWINVVVVCVSVCVYVWYCIEILLRHGGWQTDVKSSTHIQVVMSNQHSCTCPSNQTTHISKDFSQVLRFFTIIMQN